MRLLDGGVAAELPVEIEGVEGPLVATRSTVTRVADAQASSRRLRSCLRMFRSNLRPDLPVVHRVSRTGESVTVREAGGRYVDGCDDSAGPREGGRAWCGSATGRLYSGRLRDPRLDLACRTSVGGMMGFAWIEPGPEARYVAVDQPGYTEVYEVAGGLPVRVMTTTGISVERSSAAFEITEPDAGGKLLHRRHVDAAVAG